MEKAPQPAKRQAYLLISACEGRLQLDHQTHVRATLLFI